MRFLIAIAVALALLLSCHYSTQKQSSHSSAVNTATHPTQQPAEFSDKPRPTSGQKAQQQTPQPAGLTTRFSGANAWKHLHQQVAFGPRVPGSRAHKACRKYLAQYLLDHCDVVEQQEFSVPQANAVLPMVNLIGRFKVSEPRRVLLAAHWDSRPTADMNLEGQRDQPIAGANDGASGVAVLLELARLLHEQAPPIGVDIVLFDGEDYGPGNDMMYLGAKYFANRLTARQIASYNYGVLLDMIGDRQLDIHPENNSEAAAPVVYAVAMDISEQLGYRAFKQSGVITILDDHLPLIERGMRMYDFIDFNYPYWHTTQDTEDKCSKESLEMVGRVMENMVYKYSHIYAPETAKPAV